MPFDQAQETTGQTVDPKPQAFDAITNDRSDLAIPPLVRWLDRTPGDAVAWQLLANAYRAEQRSDDAYAAFGRLVALRPDDPKAILGLAMTAHDTGRPAAHLFGQIVAAGHGNADIILSAAAALTAEGELAVAEQLLERAVKERPAWLAGHDALASLRWRYGDAERVGESFAIAARTSADPMLAIGQIRTLLQAGHPDRAAEVLGYARSRYGQRPDFDAIDASIAIALGDNERAAVLFDHASGIDDLGTRIAHLRHCIRLGNLDKAETLLAPLMKGPMPSAAWPYQSVIWRLRQDARADWLEGTPPYRHVGRLALDDATLIAVATMLDSLHAQRRHPFDQSPRGGTQTDGNLFDHHDAHIQRLRAAVVTAVQAYASALPHDPAHPFLMSPRSDIRFSGSWSIRLRSGGHHMCHTHPKGWLSGVVYIAIPSDDELGGDGNGALELGRPPDELRTGLPAYTRVTPVSGRIVLFPSTTWHATVPFDRGTRLTIAFDVARPRF